MSIDFQKEYKDYRAFFVTLNTELDSASPALTVSDCEQRVLNQLKEEQAQLDGLTLKECYQKNFSSQLPAEKKHFVIEALQNSWWNSVLPSRYSIYLWLEGPDGETKEILIRILKGKMDFFFAPDWTGVDKISLMTLESRVQVLNRKYDQKFIGFRTTSSEWQNWLDSPKPWKAVLKSIRTSETKMSPLKLSVLSLIGFRGAFGI